MHQIFLRTHRDSSRSSIVRTGLAAPNFKEAEVVVPAGEGVIEGLRAASDDLYFTVRDGALKRLQRLAWGAKQPATVRLPMEGAVSLLGAAPDMEGVVVGLATWTRAREIFEVAADGKVRNTGLGGVRLDAEGRRVSRPAGNEQLSPGEGRHQGPSGAVAARRERRSSQRWAVQQDGGEAHGRHHVMQAHLLDLEYEGGHGQGGTKGQQQREPAKLYAFLLQQAGRAEFQSATSQACANGTPRR